MCLLDVLKVNEVLKSYFNVDEDELVNMFLNGYCFEYYNVLKSIYPEVSLVLEKGKSHCGALDKSLVYDASGYRLESDFMVPSAFEQDFVKNFFGRFSDDTRNDVISYVKKKVGRDNYC